MVIGSLTATEYYAKQDALYSKRASSEEVWVHYQPWLLSIGYALRPRYHPGWTPSWRSSGRKITESEDHIISSRKGVVMDATRLSDNRTVILKITPTSTKELPIWQYLTSPALLQDSRNHCVPILDVHPLPDDDESAITVMPLLIIFNIVPFQTMGEIYSCLYHLLEGLAFMHEHNVAHMDICAANTFLDPGSLLFPQGFHPARVTLRVDPRHPDRIHSRAIYTCRTLASVRDFFIDFGESVQFQDKDSRQRISTRVGHYLDVPEYADGTPFDPFMLDIRVFGEMINDEVLKPYEGTEELKDFVAKLRQDTPEDRPTAGEALEALRDLIQKQSLQDLQKFVRETKRSASSNERIYRRFHLRAQLEGRHPIQPPIQGIEVEEMPSLGIIAKLRLRYALWRLP
ncbi:hypothetical protein SISSUDRAFT_1117906 [Sistotremastrum suecicum HHB10207 ss-3]|uniref:Protein kinase domain-containing protein n=1 Tax=Sistotremastrum suecicum HHB10207 ss-3 TaxID=1314776 RepID=A0A166FWW9_9AGAM|nr:hypothetical protein SISSUDRAFT_1117906 [Sistotremastrum suecicum HHB10207 ss-3]